MTQYARGANFEREIRNDLDGKGYFCVRSAGSHSPVDILALDEGCTLFIQAKTGGAISLADWNALYNLASRYRCIPLVAERCDGKIKYSEINSTLKPRQRRDTAMNVYKP